MVTCKNHWLWHVWIWMLSVASTSWMCRVQLGECLKTIIHADYPEQWPCLLEWVKENLQASNVYGALFVLRILARKYEWVYYVYSYIFFPACLIALHTGLLTRSVKIVYSIFCLSIPFQLHGPQKDPCGFNIVLMKWDLSHTHNAHAKQRKGELFIYFC